MARQESSPGIVAHTLAVIVSVLTVVGMWAFTEQMMRQKVRWAELSYAEVVALQLAGLLVNYGYIIAPLTIVIAYGLTLAIATAAGPKHHGSV